MGGAEIESIRPLIAILFPAICSIFIIIFREHPNIRESWTILASILQFSIIFSLAPEVAKGDIIVCKLFTIMPGLDFAFRIDAFGMIFAITASFLWILVSFYSIGYMRSLEEHAQTRYFFCFCWAIFGAVGVAMAKNLVTLYVFYEILTVSTYPLVAHDETDEALFAGRKYLAYLMTAGCFLLAATVITYYLTGTTDFEPGGILTIEDASPMFLRILFAIFILGFMKAAYMPFHSWLPTAMVAPTPVSALLHAVAVVKAGVFGIIRTVCYVYGIELMHSLNLGVSLALFATFTIIVANLFALAQDNLKRRLAYSTINQLSLIIFGVALLSEEGIKGAMMHIPFHGFMKITLFLCAGSIMVATGKKNISEMKGVGWRMPITMLAFTIGALGMCALPPTAGYITHHYFAHGCEHSAGILHFFPYVLLIASILDVMYFFPIIYTAFCEKPAEDVWCENGWCFGEPSPFIVIPLTITAIGAILFFFFPNLFYVERLAELAVKSVAGE